MITFLQDNEGWACMAGSTTLGRIDETADGFVLTIGTRPPETFGDVGDAQVRAMDIYQPFWRQEDAAAVEDARKAEATARAEAARRAPPVRQPRGRSPWKGGPKQGTKFARALAIRDGIRSRDHVMARDLWDNRGRSEGHAKAYAFAEQAVWMLSEAQGMSGHAACRRIEGNLRGRAARLLAKAEALMPEVRRIDREHLDSRLSALGVADAADA